MLRPLVCLSLLVSLLLAPRIASAQQNRWQNLQQLAVGQKVKVIDREHKSYSGSFVRFSDADVTLLVKGREIKIDRDDVSRITTGPQHRTRNVLIGLAAGAAAGGAIAGCCLERETGYGGAAAGSVGGFAAIGAGIGAIIQPSKTIYRVEQGKQARSQAAPGQASAGGSD